MAPLESFGLGFVLALSLAAPPGPVNAVIASEGALRASRGTLVGLGAATADAIFLFLTLALGSWLPEPFRRPLLLAGAAVFIAMALMAVTRGEAKPGKGGTRYLVGLAMGLTNPFQIAWWLTAGVSLIGAFGPTVAVGFFSGLLAWVTAFPLAVRRGVVAFGGRVLRLVRLISAALLVTYGLWFVYLYFSSGPPNV